MADGPWITIVGLGEDGPEALQPASRKALESAEVVMGAKRHLALLPPLAAEIVEWPVPFAEGLPILASFQGRKVVVLASGDPFWFGAGAVIAREFDASEWLSLPAPSTFALAASRLGWALESTVCLGLHAAPLSRLRPHLAPGARCLVLLRDGEAVVSLAQYLRDEGFGDSQLTILEALGGPHERVTPIIASAIEDADFKHPVCAALEVRGDGAAIPCVAGLADSFFDTDGVMTKRPVRAMTLSTLAPKPGELLWDIGGGSGTVAIEWLLAHPRCAAITVELRADRIALIEANALKLGVDRLRIIAGHAPEALAGLPAPDAVFVGGGLSAPLLEALERLVPAGTRIVANAVTLEAEALLSQWHRRKGGEMLRIETATAAPLGAKTGWKAGYPVVQWSGVL